MTGRIEVHGDAGLGRLSDADFEYVRGLIESATGIQVAAKRALVVGRLSRRARELGLGSLHEYCTILRAGPGERQSLFEAICTHETQFFREPEQLHVLLARARAWCRSPRPSPFRVWSAGCSTGEEAWSIAMTLADEQRKAPELRFDVLGTDLSHRALATARAAIYPLTAATTIPASLLRAFARRGHGPHEGQLRIAPDLRALVRLVPVNLQVAPYAIEGRFEAIFCRNVLIYFSRSGRDRVVSELFDRLAPGGALYLGHAEGFAARGLPAKAIAPAVFVRRAEQGLER